MAGLLGFGCFGGGLFWVCYVVRCPGGQDDLLWVASDACHRFATPSAPIPRTCRYRGIHMAAPWAASGRDWRHSLLKRRNPCSCAAGVSSFLVPGDDLLSHGEAPHYHRRCVVSLLSSRWGQVVPTLYVRQANWFEARRDSNHPRMLLSGISCIHYRTCFWIPAFAGMTLGRGRGALSK